MSGTVVLLHAHPDDEAIFTGGTMALLAADGWRVVLVTATRGEEGTPRFPLPPGEAVATRREAETRAAAAILGVTEVRFLGYHDSGVPEAGAVPAPGAFGACDVGEAAAAVARVCDEVAADALVAYDEGGIYRHPDHLMVHRVGRAAAEAAGLPTWYEATVDHEYLHFVDVHLVAGANGSLAERATVGLPTALITTPVDCRAVLEHKWRAMAAHASQIPDADPHLPPERFADVYGYEWFVRHGPRGPVEALVH
ncbi:MAG TPA: PIG-L family deacetylase [Euzebya sp.]|nr:PIG-L family deacetylase [Euzebya sp.]